VLADWPLTALATYDCVTCESSRQLKTFHMAFSTIPTCLSTQPLTVSGTGNEYQPSSSGRALWLGRQL